MSHFPGGSVSSTLQQPGQKSHNCLCLEAGSVEISQVTLTEVAFREPELQFVLFS